MRAVWPLLLLAWSATGCGDSVKQAEANVDPSVIEGAWRLLDRGTGTEQPSAGDQPGLRLYVDGHYSVVMVDGTEPRPPLPDSAGTAELMAVWAPFTANAGTYDVAGEIITQRPLVSKNPLDMERGAFNRLRYRRTGDTLWLTQIDDRDGPVVDTVTSSYVRVRGGADPLRGAWSHIERARMEGGKLLANQPGLRLYADGYYSFIRVSGTEPRPPLPDSTATAADLRAVWGPIFTATSGTYQVSGDSITERQLVAKNPTDMAAGAVTINRLRLSADTLWAIGIGGAEGPVPISDEGIGRYVRVRARPAPAN